MLKEGVVYINGSQAKPAKEVRVGDIITIKYLKGERSYEVLQIPAVKNIPKARMAVVREV